MKQLLKELKSELESKFKDNFTGLILFGSYAKGTQNKNSDLDLILVFKKLPQNRLVQSNLVIDIFLNFEEKYSLEINYILTEEKKLGKSPLLIDIAPYAKIIYDKNKAIENLFNSIKKDYDLGIFKKLIDQNSYILKIENV